MAMKNVSEKAAHVVLYSRNLSDLIPSEDIPEGSTQIEEDEYDELHLWKIIKHLFLERYFSTARKIRNGEMIGTNINLPTGATRPMELDILGSYEDGLFIMELKTKREAERNAFTELLGYTNYFEKIFPAIGPSDITSVLVAPVFSKITRQAILFDTLINKRNTVVFTPEIQKDDATDLRLRLWTPTDEDFMHLANDITQDDRLSCYAVSFDDLEGWLPDGKPGDSLCPKSKAIFEQIAMQAALFMEKEGIHGFVTARKLWGEHPFPFKNHLYFCAINPFQNANREIGDVIVSQLKEEVAGSFYEMPVHAFEEKLANIAHSVIDQALPKGAKLECDFQSWRTASTSAATMVMSHHISFIATGLLGEAFNYYVSDLYHNDHGDGDLPHMPCEARRSFVMSCYFMAALEAPLPSKRPLSDYLISPSFHGGDINDYILNQCISFVLAIMPLVADPAQYRGIEAIKVIIDGPNVLGMKPYSFSTAPRDEAWIAGKRSFTVYPAKLTSWQGVISEKKMKPRFRRKIFRRARSEIIKALVRSVEMRGPGIFRDYEKAIGFAKRVTAADDIDYRVFEVNPEFDPAIDAMLGPLSVAYDKIVLRELDDIRNDADIQF